MVGTTLSMLRKAPKTRLTNAELEVCFKMPTKCVDQDLVRRLLAIDKKYEARCGGGCLSPPKEKRDNVQILLCDDEWEEARRVAIEGE
jgi:hypothetical protein